MTASIRSQRRRFLALLGAGVMLAVSPVGFGFDPDTGALRLLPPAAYAGDDDDNSGHGGGDDRGDDSSGHGGGDDRDDDRQDDSDDNDRDDDRNVGGDDDRADDDRSGTGGDDGGGGDGGGRDAPPDISLRYEDGWIEQIVDGRYELFDDKGRRVIRRRADMADYARMAALLS